MSLLPMFEPFSQSSFAKLPSIDWHLSHHADKQVINPTISCDHEIEGVDIDCHLGSLSSSADSSRSLSPELVPIDTPLPIDIIAIIARCLQCDGAANTLASLQSLCRETYILITPILYGRLRVTEYSWDRLFTLFEIPIGEIRFPIEALDDLLDGSQHPIEHSAYVRRRWLFSLIEHLELVSLGNPDSIRAVAALNERLYDNHSEHLLFGLQTMHITDAYTARSIANVEDLEGRLVSEWYFQECQLALLCPKHKLCIHLPKDDSWTESISTARTSAQSRDAYIRGHNDGVAVMRSGSSIPINATAITIHNAGTRFVFPPHSEQHPHYRLSFLSSPTASSDNRPSRQRLLPRAYQMAHFLLAAYNIYDPQARRPGAVTIFKPVSGPDPKVSSDLKMLKRGTAQIARHLCRGLEPTYREKFLRQVDSVELVLELDMPQGGLGICDVCDEPY